MFKKKKRIYGSPKLTIQNAGWRRYQHRLKSRDERRHSVRRLPKYLFFMALFALLIQGGFKFLDHIMLRQTAEAVPISTPKTVQLDHQTLQLLVKSYPFQNLTQKDFEITAGTGSYRIHTSLDTDLQRSIIDSLDLKHAQSIGIVAMIPDTGQVVAMVSHDRFDEKINASLKADCPAASLFKIVTAAAALETCGITDQTKLAFNGGKYTLYKSQLTDKKNQYTNYTSLEDAFADSINPVFGKIGQNRLGKSPLEKYGEAFYFNRLIEFDFPVETSFLEISDKPYNWAEIACGFNRKTTISPLHGAMLAAAVVNNGQLVAPSVINTATADDQIVYQRKTKSLGQAIKPDTAHVLKRLMNATVRQGTARNAFRGSSKDRILADLEIGGKTGSINNNPEHVKFDWIVGFAESKTTSQKIAVCVLVAHKKYIGTRAASYFRTVISEYFKIQNDTSKVSLNAL